MSNRTIGKMTLECKGAFTCQLVIHYKAPGRSDWSATSRSDKVSAGKSVTWYPMEHGVPAGSLVQLEAIVNAGNDKKASEQFLYQPGDLSSVSYQITGTTLINSLKGPDYTHVDRNTLSKRGLVTLRNEGAFVCKVCFCWFDSVGKLQETGNSRDLPVLQTDLVDPGDLGVPNGSVCFLKVIVVAGSDRSSPVMFIYRKGGLDGYAYTIKGTTLDGKLSDPRPILNTAAWMGNLDKSVRIIDTKIPASHDASAYPVMSITGIAAVVGGAYTQDGNYAEQLRAGSRYFDMRCKWSIGGSGKKQIYLKHGKAVFDTLENVLKDEIVPFVRDRDEVIFLDIDQQKEDGLDKAILDMLLKYIPESWIATAHLNPNGTFRAGATWQALAGKKFVIAWESDETFGRPWLTHRNRLRESPYDAFDDKPPEAIVQFLDKAERAWNPNDTSARMFVAQAINTPKVSPIQQPAILDEMAKDFLNGWIKKHWPNEKINVVFRDFFTRDYNRDAIEHLIRLNRFVPQ